MWIQLIQDASGHTVSVLSTVRLHDEFFARPGSWGHEVSEVWGGRNMLQQNFGMCRNVGDALLVEVRVCFLDSRLICNKFIQDV